jgi:thymidylate synthase (FAD)
MRTHYEQNLEEDMARELARLDLPLSMYTYWYWKIDLHNLFHFLSLRMDPHAQWEIQQYAHIIAHMVKEQCPLAYEAFVDYRLCGCTFSRMERKLLNGICNSFDFEHGPDIAELNAAADQYGMTERERKEFWAKLVDPNFELNKLPKPLPAQYFMDKIAEASG